MITKDPIKSLFFNKIVKEKFIVLLQENVKKDKNLFNLIDKKDINNVKINIREIKRDQYQTDKNYIYFDATTKLIVDPKILIIDKFIEYKNSHYKLYENLKNLLYGDFYRGSGAEFRLKNKSLYIISVHHFFC